MFARNSSGLTSFSHRLIATVATFLLPGFDEFVLGYGDRSAVLDPAFADRIVPGGNGMFRPTVVSDGRIVGTWQWTGRGAARTVTPTPFTDFPPAVATAVPRLAASVLAAANGPHGGAKSTLSAP